MKDKRRLVVVSNRVPSTAEGPERAGAAGGLVSALTPAMEEHGGLWFGWSGRTAQRRPENAPTTSQLGKVEVATVDLSEDDASLYYTGFSNRTLWPLLHSFPERVVMRSDAYRAYRRTNRRFAEALHGLLHPTDLVWVHDYHLFHVGRELRELGWTGKMGFYLHVPFPAADIFAILPWSSQILEGLLYYDLVGVQTKRYLHNLRDALQTELGGTLAANGALHLQDASVRLGEYQVGIEPADFLLTEGRPMRGLAERYSIPRASEHRIILGVDRLDYTKGIPQRLAAFERLIERNPSMREKVTLVQISSPSRSRVPEYIEEKERVDRLVGQINGRFSEGGWTPVRYLYRTYSHSELVYFYREADVFMVTPLRDGMNLVAKEFVASQGDDPGVLVLSKFTGAAGAMSDALVVNPYDVDATAEATAEALRMGAAERKRRWRALMDEVCRHTARSWSAAFQSDLAAT